ncbi:hypothetical protein [Jatrophihabitans sp.]|uniref:hypothetical protein n=1 Tax=Jatrophihabitans sp. TaxID=1932789 RepID=UPI0030C7802F
MGQRMKSQVCESQIIVTRAPEVEALLECGGHPMIEIAAEPALGLHLDAEAANLIGKRYDGSGGALQVLVTKPGVGQLSVDGVPLELAETRALPASD